MSFALNVKEELISMSKQVRKTGQMKPCCKHAEMYGLFLFCREFNHNEISIKTENESLAALFMQYAMLITGKKPKMEKSSAGKYKVSVIGSSERAKLLAAFGHTGHEITRRLNRANLDDDCCISALIRGAFLSCGTVTDPDKDYHLEFVVSHKKLSEDLAKLFEELKFSETPEMSEKRELIPKFVERKGSYVIYFKDSESVEDLLTYIGASDASLEIMGMKMYKDMRNHVNRRMNFENANSSRAFDAAYKQIEAIRYIEETKGLGYLPDDLRELARLRLENEDYTLKDLSDNLKEPISKSGVNHRLKRILQLYEELRTMEKIEEQKNK